MQNQTIEHKGIVKKISDNSIEVSIIALAACASCHAKSACGVSDLDEKIIEIKKHSDNYHIGEQVKVYYKKSLGFRALFLGYVLPAAIVLFILIMGTIFLKNEMLSGLIALASLIPYYILLYFSKNKLNETFSFSIKKL